jgi:hypothetical protein
MPKAKSRDATPSSSDVDEKQVTCPDCEYIFVVTRDCKLAECPICVTEFRV